MEGFGQTFRVPDFWQAEAIAHLKAGRDVVLHAPTGTGKTFVFESYFKQYSRRAIYTVPTRALANDKFAQWSADGWRVGIATGDRLENPDAPLVVATLETQRENIFANNIRGLFVVDEYQLLGDESRGAAYETAIATLPLDCQLLLMSGSVENSGDVADWLTRVGRNVRLVRHDERAVPIEEVCSTSLPEISTRHIRGYWPTIVQRAIESDMCPLLIFAPKRRDAENIAQALAAELPCADFLKIPRETESLAGRSLARLLRKKIAFHHSGLTAYQRAGIVEKYARAGSLKVVVATTGLGAGVNFSMKSVIVADREYETAEGAKLLRPDELLQMYGRAGRRGKDTVGYAINLPSKPSLSQAHSLFLERSDFTDWGAILRIMDSADNSSAQRVRAANDFCSRLFSKNPPELGFSSAKIKFKKPIIAKNRVDSVRTEILNSRNLWERRKPKRAVPISQALYFSADKWVRFDTSAEAVKKLKRGAVCRLADGRFGLFLEIAKADSDGWRPTRILSKMTRKFGADIPENPLLQPFLTAKNIKRNLQKYIQIAFAGASCAEIADDGKSLSARIDLASAKIETYTDSFGAYLFNPPTRSVGVAGEWNFERLAGFKGGIDSENSLASIWCRLGLIDESLALTRKGRIFSFFAKAEGLAIAAALEDLSYAVEDIVFDLANLRAGRRFAMSESKSEPSTRMGDLCALSCLSANIKGYLRAGMPLEYGAGAAEIMRAIRAGTQSAILETKTLTRGDIERARLEWESLLRHCALAPDLDWDRWRDFKAACSAALSPYANKKSSFNP